MPDPSHQPFRSAALRVWLPALVVAGLLLISTGTVRADVPATVNSPDGVNLRVAPSTTSQVLMVLPLGITVTVVGSPTDDGWVPVLYNATSGFVKAEFLTMQPATAAPTPPAASPTPTATPAATATATPTPATASATPTPAVTATPTPSPAPVTSMTATVADGDGLNLRSGPGTTFAVVTLVPGGAKVQVVGQPNADGWYSVTYNGRQGWVDGRYLTLPAGSTPALGLAIGSPAVTTSSAASAPSPASSRFIWPVASRRISTAFNAATHPGIDLDEFPTGGNPTMAVADGTVTFAGGNTCCSYGLYIQIKHADGYTTLYAHLSSIDVKEGQTVKQGQVIGKTGNTGRSTGAHLHFEVRKDGVAIDPLTLLSGNYRME